MATLTEMQDEFSEVSYKSRELDNQVTYQPQYAPSPQAYAEMSETFLQKEEQLKSEIMNRRVLLQEPYTKVFTELSYNVLVKYIDATYVDNHGDYLLDKLREMSVEYHKREKVDHVIYEALLIAGTVMNDNAMRSLVLNKLHEMCKESLSS